MNRIGVETDDTTALLDHQKGLLDGTVCISPPQIDLVKIRAGMDFPGLRSGPTPIIEPGQNSAEPRAVEPTRGSAFCTGGSDKAV